jgi:hypothetical protein
VRWLILLLCMPCLGQTPPLKHVATPATAWNYQVDCNPKVQGTIKLEYVDITGANPSFTATADASKGPFTVSALSGGPTIVYLRVTCTSTDGSIPTQVAIFKLHYPDAPVVITPDPPHGIQVTI